MQHQGLAAGAQQARRRIPVAAMAADLTSDPRGDYHDYIHLYGLLFVVVLSAFVSSIGISRTNPGWSLEKAVTRSVEFHFRSNKYG
jgi:hypothetical protein